MDWDSDVLQKFKPPPFVPPKDAEIHKDIQYSSSGHVRQRLDLYLPPESKRRGPMPLIVYIHGKFSHPLLTDRFGADLPS